MNQHELGVCFCQLKLTSRRILPNCGKNRVYSTVAVWTQKPFTSVLICPLGSQGCQNKTVRVLVLRLTQNWRNFKKPSKLRKHTFLNIPQFGLNISTPNNQNIGKEVLPDIFTPLAPPGARQYGRYQLFNICFDFSVWYFHLADMVYKIKLLTDTFTITWVNNLQKIPFL